MQEQADSSQWLQGIRSGLTSKESDLENSPELNSTSAGSACITALGCSAFQSETVS